MNYMHAVVVKKVLQWLSIYLMQPSLIQACDQQLQQTSELVVYACITSIRIVQSCMLFWMFITPRNYTNCPISGHQMTAYCKR